jgi:uncharacterized protein (TIGR02118 family)
MAGHKLIQIVASQSTPEKEETFNKWYSEVHVPMFFGYKGLKKASRYKRLGDDDKSARYLAIYEFDTKKDLDGFTKSPEFAAAVEDFEKMKDKVGFTARWAASYELLTTIER